MLLAAPEIDNRVFIHKSEGLMLPDGFTIMHSCRHSRSDATGSNGKRVCVDRVDRKRTCADLTCQTWLAPVALTGNESNVELTNLTMLSSDFPKTPRPKPPAKARRASAQVNSEDWRSPPPPAYTPIRQHLPILLGSPISATTSFIQHNPLCEEDVQERSRDELEELLGKASSIIREREQGMSPCRFTISF